jgi:hypothetical protein
MYHSWVMDFFWERTGRLRHVFLFVILTGMGAAGCATAVPEPPVALPPSLTRQDVITLVKAGASDEAVISRIESTRTVFVLSVDDIVSLKEQGVSSAVIEYMRGTEMRERERAAAAQERRRWQNASRTYWWWDDQYGHPWRR